MKLWVLRPVEGLKDGNNPWDPWYDKVFGFVVRAKSEDEARDLAHKNAGDENSQSFLGKVTSKTNSPWKSPKHSTCEILENKGEEGIVIKDFASA